MSQGPISSGQRSEHWDAAYETRGASGVSWFQPAATTSIQLIERLGIAQGGAVIDVGGGASVLTDALLNRGFTDVSVLDLSNAALAEVRERLGSNTSLSLLQEDLLAWSPDRQYDLWHDRAVFHFLVDPNDREIYLRTLRSALRPEGFVIIATFAWGGPEYCSGLPVCRYSSGDLAEALGPTFQVIEAFCDQHVTPAGVGQPFTWVAARHADSDQEGRDRDG